ncbi:RNA polymerase sigma factor [Mongoliitalea lutea]|uniref:RNA polymerase sigma factor, sigma-70 family n=1 Tax=Mongoliitalea lutea TaxID=849756 RepID=A0A8J3CV86_9BACT|nr:sigma-70 family RNA polymerase sigma factor [Mongoliitalea lutea]GHB26265.1 hypothetical protein GCM10008106_03560 [Mongoliitalea lutea]
MEELVKQLKSGDQRAIGKVYEAYRKPFFDFAKRYNLDYGIIEDTYQDVILALVENAMKGKLDNLSSSLKTYVFAIGKYMIFQRLRKINSGPYLLAELPESLEWDDHEEHAELEQVKLLEKYLSSLGDRCREIINLSYYQQKSADDITQILNYPNKETLKSQKSRCLQHLKKMFQSHGKG